MLVSASKKSRFASKFSVLTVSTNQTKANQGKSIWVSAQPVIEGIWNQMVWLLEGKISSCLVSFVPQQILWLDFWNVDSSKCAVFRRHSTKTDFLVDLGWDSEINLFFHFVFKIDEDVFFMTKYVWIVLASKMVMTVNWIFLQSSKINVMMC